ncbi:MAG: LodA/GoxA family CTQ-dependent oxidase [Candidatus Thiodiazotropha taylori]|nr:LodA/GoxA family CTQ-dependent oxidase [Candidatus Thiodiazotropha taylori]
MPIQDEIAYMKIHPAIGVARLANNTDYFEFFEAHAKGFSPPHEYMSDGERGDPKPGLDRLKRQAVKFKVFAYDSNNILLGELHELIPGAEVHWSAKVANRKLFNYTRKSPIQANLNSIEAQGTATSSTDLVPLNGQNPWDPTEEINLGSISGDGLFIPARGDVVRKDPNSTIDPFPADQSGYLQTTDSTCDGEIHAAVFDENGSPFVKDIISAWIVSAPSQHALTLTPAVAEEMNNNFGRFLPSNANQNKDWIKATKVLLGINGVIFDPTGLDVPMMRTLNADYKPGMEVNIEGTSRLESGINPADFFYPRGIGPIGQNEIRIQPSTAQSAGTLPGQLTSGLCSTWQGDMVACLNYWTAENPNQAYIRNQQETVIYEEGNVNRQMTTPEHINEWMDFRGIVEYEPDGADIRLEETYDPNRP